MNNDDVASLETALSIIPFLDELSVSKRSLGDNGTQFAITFVHKNELM